MKVLAIVNHKGGVSKTTLAKLLAEYFARRGVRVCGVDIDPQCNFSARFLEMEFDEASEGLRPPVHPSYDPDAPEDADWTGRCSSATIFRSGWALPYITQIDGLSVVPGSGPELAYITELVKQRSAEGLMRDLLRDWLHLPDNQDLADLVILDTPPSKGPLIDAVFRAATHILVPTKMEEMSIEGLFSMLAYWNKENALRTAEQRISLVGVLPTQVDRRYSDHKAFLEFLSTDETLSPYMLRQAMGTRAAYNSSNNVGANPSSVLDLSESNETRKEAVEICEAVEAQLR